MPTHISQIMGVTHEQLEEAGVFDKFIDIDSALHVDPYLIRHSAEPEMKAASEDFAKDCADTMRIIVNIAARNDAFFQEAKRRCTFPENKHGSLGYGSNSVAGSGIGSDLASEILHTAIEIINAGVKDVTIFELMGVFQENLGPDRISDMTCGIVKPRLERVMHNLRYNCG
jgi:hypothetical protein